MDKLPKVKARSKKRLGRGYGSGKGGHTSSRGQKGQKSRGKKVGILFEGVKMKKSLIRRLPLQRGKDRNKSYSDKINLTTEDLNIFKNGDKVNLESLVKSGLISAKDKNLGVKILAKGELTKKLTVEVPASSTAAQIITKAGGTVNDR